MKLYNFLSRKKENFRPRRAKSVGFYTCGPTVYDFAHIGNFRAYIFEDILRRTLEYVGYQVKQVMNITDIDDKIIRKARAHRMPTAKFVKPYEKAFFNDLKKLNIKPAWKYPRATKHIPEMIALISKLLKKGLAYEEGGSIYFDISKFKRYGRLSRLKPKELKPGLRTRPVFDSEVAQTRGEQGRRIDADEYTKQNVRDFVLWKGKSASRRTGEPSWKARFGKGPALSVVEGRPGWHIECSAMSMKYLGKSFDIHAGGVDLIFPHHENEIAQSEGATGEPFVQFFMEGEHLLVDGKKMSKSLHNMFTLKDIEKRGFDPLVFRYLALTAHYRSRLNFTWKALEGAKNSLRRIRERMVILPKRQAQKKIHKAFRKEFMRQMEDDLDTPGALRVFWKHFDVLSQDDIVCVSQIFGLNLERWRSSAIPAGIKKLIKEREEFRRKKEWQKADKIRAQIQKLGWQIEDTAKGPVLKSA